MKDETTPKNPLHLSYRPQDFDQVIGQATAVKALKQSLNNAHAFLLCGPSGVGKTTLARIAARKLGVESQGIIEIDGATYTGVDAMRTVQEQLSYRTFGKSGGKVIILDEAHRLSGNAWDSLLKVIEEPPSHVTWFLCTTNAAKVPVTIKTRCITIQLQEVSNDDLEHLCMEVCQEEHIKLHDDVCALIVRQAQGSPRQLLVNLELCRTVQNKKEAARLLQTALEGDPTIELCRFVMSGGSWKRAMAIVEKLDGESPEGVRIVACNYIGKALRNAGTDEQAMRLLTLLDNFATPYNPGEGLAPLLLSIGRCIYTQD